MQCLECKKEFVPTFHLRNYCSQYCRENSFCIICNTPFKRTSQTRRNKYCSHKCAIQFRNLKIKESVNKKSSLQWQKIYDKCKATKLQKYGSETYNNMDKRKATNLQKYGSETYNNMDKRKATNLQKYGVEYSLQAQFIKNKSKATNLQKYGVEYSSQAQWFKNKVSETSLKNHGVSNISQSPLIKQKKETTCLARYGTKSYLAHLNRKNILHKDHYNEDYVKSHFIKDGVFLRQEAMDYFNVSYATSFNMRDYFNISLKNYVNKLRQQKYIFNNIKCVNKLFNDKTILPNLELDIYLKDFNLAIEYNGLMFHSQGKSNIAKFNTPTFDKNYHLNKTLLCEKQGIQLLHIFEGEDLNLWLDVIHSKMRLNKTIYARNCEIREISNNTQEIRDFLKNNHLQGYSVYKISFGLYFNNDLVALMTFGKSRYNKQDYELIRFASLRGLHIAGGASKLLSHFEKKFHPKSLISYANKRFSQGNLYEKLGFKWVGDTSPNYFYFKRDLILHSRVKFQKHKLSKLLANYDKQKTEAENMLNNGYRRIFDCGQKVYIKQYI